MRHVGQFRGSTATSAVNLARLGPEGVAEGRRYRTRWLPGPAAGVSSRFSADKTRDPKLAGQARAGATSGDGAPRRRCAPGSPQVPREARSGNFPVTGGSTAVPRRDPQVHRWPSGLVCTQCSVCRGFCCGLIGTRIFRRCQLSSRSELFAVRRLDGGRGGAQ
jgi:hypothetical protein